MKGKNRKEIRKLKHVKVEIYNDYEEKIPYMQTFRRYLRGTFSLL